MASGGGRRAEYINNKMRNGIYKNINMVRDAHWNNAEVTEVTGRDRKRREALMHRT